MTNTPPREAPSLYRRIYAVVAEIPPGRVATYGQIAAIVGRCSPRVVGYAMAASPAALDLPWQRVINSQGRVSARSSGEGSRDQRALLEAEGVVFDVKGCVDFSRFAWLGPQWEWLQAHDCHLAPPPS